MAGMQLAVPSIEEGDSPHKDGSLRVQGVNNQSTDESSYEGRSERSILPEELHASFQAMKAVRRQMDRDNGENSEKTSELKRKARQQALETAIAANSEIEKWQNGIAELEAMLASESSEDGSNADEEEEDNLGGHHFPAPAIRFPSLPPIVVPEDDSSVE